MTTLWKVACQEDLYPGMWQRWFKNQSVAVITLLITPNHLEDGLLPNPNSNIRERLFQDRTRLDVLLIDRANTPVISECKPHAPDQKIKQLRRYMMLLREETGQVPRGILVHGGASKLSRNWL